MRTRELFFAVTLAGVGLYGCSGELSKLTSSQDQAKKQAEQRWDTVRGKIKLQLATESFKQGELDEAQKHLTEALSLDPTLPDTYILQTRILLERGEIAAAQESLAAAMAKGATGAEADYLTGMIAQRYARFEDALAAYRRAAEREPRQAHYTAAVAETLVALDRPAEALKLIQDRWTDFEHNATLRATAGQIYLLLGSYEQAADVYRDAVRIAPDDITLQYQLGLALALADKHTEAVDVLAPLSAKHADMPGYILVALGRSYLGLDRYEQCKAILTRATETSPESVGPWSWLARAALTAGDLVTAREAAARAADLETKSAEPLILLGYVCLRQGDRGAAVKALQTALQRQPNDPMAMHLLDRVQGRTSPVGERIAPTVLQEVKTP